MLLVCSMVFAPRLLPFAIVRKEGVSLCWCVVNLCETQALGLVNQSAIETGTTYYIYVLVRLTRGDEAVPVLEALAAGKLLLAARQHAVAAVG